MSELTREQLIEMLIKITGAIPHDSMLRCDVLAHDAKQRERIAKLEARLEIDYALGVDGKRVEIPPQKRDTFPDGIFCRDETIKLQHERIDALNAELEDKQQTIDAQLREAATLNECITDLEAELEVARRQLADMEAIGQGLLCERDALKAELASNAQQAGQAMKENQ